MIKLEWLDLVKEHEEKTMTHTPAMIQELYREREELLAALKKIEAYLERWADEPECGEFYEIARAAIAKAEGKS